MKLTILETSDIHGYLYPTDYSSRAYQHPFGALKAATVIKEEKKNAPGPVIAVDNGDFLQGSAYSYFVAKENKEPTELIKAYNQIGYDVAICGNHEWNYGREYLNKAVEALAYPVLSANILNAAGEPFFGQPYRIFNFDGCRVGILGVTTQYIPNWEKPQTIEGLTFRSVVDTVKDYYEQLKDEMDVFIVSYHGGFERDLETGEPTELLTGENEGYQLLMDVPEIDVLLTGHQHRTIATHIHGVPVIQPGEKGRYVGKIVLDIDQINGAWHVNNALPELIDTSDYEMDESIRQALEEQEQQVQNWLDQSIGHVSGDMRITDPFEARVHEHPYIEFVQRVQMDAAQTTISGTALFSQTSPGFEENIRMRDILVNYIYPNTLAVVKITGRDLKAAIEQSAEYFDYDEQGQLTMSESFKYPKPKHYNYDMYEGVDYTIDVRQPVGERVTRFERNGQPIEMDEELEVVVNQYRAVGGGNYDMFGADKVIREVQIDVSELIANYLEKHPTIQAQVNNNFEVRY
ncbi:bifunctional metallophosphatase/5'-nucleotidase [Atopobacter phocae]|uniref:bifunctional metallophosphatase/5'-nucleotidase n=1 Tax=Atopobacter phocae TaxID=136492 RepID=UPI00046EBF51|nr:bifunctional UDP-sugar hydrolase/5'-nucleotidase [Atopobacter phocae]